MKTSLKILLWPIVAIFIPTYTFCQNNEKIFDSLLHAQFPVSGPGGTVLIARDKQVLYNKAFGKSNIELNIPMTVDNVFRIGSITKQFTAVAILKLIEEGKLNLLDEVTKFIPDYPSTGKTITIANLLSHTSGIKNYTGMSNFTKELKRTDLTPKALVGLFKDETPDFNPGTAYQYSNSNYVLLGYIIELITGESYGSYIDKTFFQPLGMKNSYYDSSSRIIPQRTSGYRHINGEYENAEFLSMTLPYAAGSLLSTTGDLLIWYNALMSGKVIPLSVLSPAHHSYQLNNGKLTGYGYGWEIGNVQGEVNIKHTGVVNGFVTYVSYLPAEKIFIAIFSNVENIGDLDIPGSKIAGYLLGKPFNFQRINISEDDLNVYQAVYHNEYDGNKIIACENGRLSFFTKGGQKQTLIPYKKDGFYLDQTLITIQFNRDQKGKVEGYQMTGTGLTTKWKKISQNIQAKNTLNVSAKILATYAGRYLFKPDMVFEIIVENDRIYGKVGADKKELIPYEKNKFYALDIDATIIFNLNADARVISLTKIQNNEMFATRMEETGNLKN
ncbi:serine hydrolase [Pedobacter antarcticus]|uniref:serine hydrolase n=1 Tax=Pedobacter antarcticus TaxID=34086 RepID=UPI0029305C55|nr:serine hydrolase [Pedobacter antarcticus]